MPTILARLWGFEPKAYGLEGRCSIQLSYRRMPHSAHRRRVCWETCQKLALSRKTNYILNDMKCQGKNSAKLFPAHFCFFSHIKTGQTRAFSDSMAWHFNEKRVHRICVLFFVPYSCSLFIWFLKFEFLLFELFLWLLWLLLERLEFWLLDWFDPVLLQLQFLLFFIINCLLSHF